MMEILVLGVERVVLMKIETDRAILDRQIPRPAGCRKMADRKSKRSPARCWIWRPRRSRWHSRNLPLN